MQSKLSQFDVFDSSRSKKGSKNGSKNHIEIADVALNTSKEHLPAGSDSVKWHKAHRCLFVFDFEGAQPTRGGESLARVGRYHTIPQARFEYPEEKAIIITLPGTLKVWIKHPKGTKTVEQIIGAHETARRLAREFARKHGIGLSGERESRFSEHTIESKPLDRLVRPVVEEEPELAKEKLGLSINQTSHKGKVEWTGRKAKDRVMGFEYMLDGGLSKDLAEIKDTLGEIVKYSKKPPELGKSTDYR